MESVLVASCLLLAFTSIHVSWWIEKTSTRRGTFIISAAFCVSFPPVHNTFSSTLGFIRLTTTVNFDAVYATDGYLRLSSV